MRLYFLGGTQKPVSGMRSGPNTRFARNSLSGMPDKSSRMRPSTSIDRPYSQTVPG